MAREYFEQRQYAAARKWALEAYRLNRIDPDVLLLLGGIAAYPADT